MLEKLILNLFSLNIIKFGNFTLKSGEQTYIYADIRSSISHPKIFKEICDLIYSKMQTINYDVICGVPYSALTFASGIAYTHSIPMLLKRKETKQYGTKKILEGDFIPGQTCILIEDVVTSGTSIIETIEPIKANGLIVKDVITFIDRNQGGKEILARNGYTLHSIIDLHTITNILSNANKISLEDKSKTLNLINYAQ
ncbi:MAG TPA: orotate phosphoribosyltransferase [Burkholderiales bacterium]|nr:orotate phosphoribosyltransferase [Burkholderiales bacterium]